MLSGIKRVEIFKGRPHVRNYANNWALSSKLLQEGSFVSKQSCKKDPAEEDKQEGVDADNVLEEMEVVRQTRLLPCQNFGQERPGHAGSGLLSFTDK